ncbi:protein FAM240C-like [Salarias fasciatus]|uniref:protein FAM240C-like n=1 Tax=Salarias fasciatus TaxID=181472 RepID=UPI001176E053|nr:protein FAM240C-like [Salarias fasciatus]
MNAARIHDKHKLRSFWEQKIEEHGEQEVEEERRRRSSALTRLREQWVVQLDHRNQHQQSFFEERMRRVQGVRQSLRKLDSP